jgi:hypothetical protein
MGTDCRARADHRFDRMALAHPQIEKEAIDDRLLRLWLWTLVPQTNKSLIHGQRSGPVIT